jgi:lipoprotein-anchoring transpeptidase ErfK/SrfK
LAKQNAAGHWARPEASKPGRMVLAHFYPLLAGGILFAASAAHCAADDPPAPPDPPVPAAPPAPVVPPASVGPAAPETYPRPAQSWLEAQIVLSRHDFSCGAIDGVGGAQSTTALRAYQDSADLPITGQLDPDTREQLVLKSPPIAPLTISVADLGRLQPLSPTWLGKSQQTALEYQTILELVAERTHASQALIRRLNPDLDWTKILPGQVVLAPSIIPDAPRKVAGSIRILLSAHVLEVMDGGGRVIAHFPVSIAQHVDKRPVGLLHVTDVIPNPDYTFDPDVFPESPEAQQLGRKLRLPPGPRNPVGLAWIGLDRPGYGIHGTPAPEKVGRTESHGCFRLANWDALTMLDFATAGLPVTVEP